MAWALASEHTKIINEIASKWHIQLELTSEGPFVV